MSPWTLAATGAGSARIGDPFPITPKPMLQTEPRPTAHDDPSGGLAHVQRLAT